MALIKRLDFVVLNHDEDLLSPELCEQLAGIPCTVKSASLEAALLLKAVELPPKPEPHPIGKPDMQPVLTRWELPAPCTTK
ncbi:MAG TPA: hypothetical protein VHB98_02015 [Chloroflexota bacterium]|jgi:hypothetical protein|nr:hypothetical protein [Chloroflexota bacterium]